MSTRQVPREEWKAFLDEFSKEHTGKHATTKLEGQGVVGERESRALPFMGITLEEKGSDAHAARIQLGDSTTDHLTHEVPGVATIWVRPNMDTGGEMLEIQGDHTLILKFQ